MKKQFLFSFLCLLFISIDNISSQEEILVSGDVTLNVNKNSDNKYGISFSAYGKTINTASEYQPIAITTIVKTYYNAYSKYVKNGSSLTMTAEVTLAKGLTFEVQDIYNARGNGEFEINRKIKVVTLGENGWKYFYSSFGLKSPNKELLDNQYFVPAVWYKGNFEEAGNIPNGIPIATDKNFFYREDRIPLPVLMMRDKNEGLTITLIHKNSKCQTVLADSKNEKINAGYQFGGVGVLNETRLGNEGVTAMITYPGSDSRTGGIGERAHPLIAGFDNHQYNVYLKIDKTQDYSTALCEAWELGCNLYDPEVRKVNLNAAYNGLIETVNYYYLSPSMNGVGAPGFPWGVNLRTFDRNIGTYEFGFVGSQPAAAYALFRAGVETENNLYKMKGESILNFWANNSLSSLGLPKIYCNSWNGAFNRAFSPMRQTCSGMEAILNAWCFAKRNGIDKPNWVDACKRFGNFLVTHQNTDGSYCFAYNPFDIVNGKHPDDPIKNKYLTVCALRYLAELYIVTNDERFKEAAIKAAEFSYENNHKGYYYVACVTDNPQTIDSESGQQAINGFLAIYDLTKDKKWLEAAEQAATYAETWSYMFEVPVEIDQTENTDWPKDRSIVGQHIIAIGHSAADLGFAWSSFVYYRLYLITGKEHYLKMARISAHNTKQSMNLGQQLYPGQPEGLQQEAFQVRVTNQPRRMGSIMEALTWNFAAHLDPMLRFKDAFGTYNLEEVEEMSEAERKELNWRYSFYQSADYGQEIDIPSGLVQLQKDHITVYSSGKQLYVQMDGILNALAMIKINDLTGHNVLIRKLVPGQQKYTISLNSIDRGVYVVNIIQPSGELKTFKILVD